MKAAHVTKHQGDTCTPVTTVSFQKLQQHMETVMLDTPLVEVEGSAAIVENRAQNHQVTR